MSGYIVDIMASSNGTLCANIKWVLKDVTPTWVYILVYKDLMPAGSDILYPFMNPHNSGLDM
jgi:hypothetical protein